MSSLPVRLAGRFAPVVLALLVAVGAGGEADAVFQQEVHLPLPLEPSGAKDTRSIAVDAAGGAWVASGAGLFRLAAGETVWRAVALEGGPGPVFETAVAAGGDVWVGAWSGLHRIEDGDGAPRRIAAVGGPVSVIAPMVDGGVIALGPTGAWRVTGDGRAEELDLGIARGAQGAVADADVCWIAAGDNLLRCETGAGGSPRVRDSFPIKSSRTLHSMRAVARNPADGSIIVGGMGGVSVAGGAGFGSLIPEGRLPNADVRAIAAAPDGTVWIGTALGAVRHRRGEASLRHGRRWLLSDDVRDIAIGPDGAAWVATGGGVSVIRPVQMTLAEKAEHYLRICHERHIRPPGLVEKCRLREPGRTETWEPRDDDNDGQYTSMYLAMESFRFAATGDAGARKRAREAFGALRLLQMVTGTKGFVARTVIPADWTSMADPNETISDAEWARRLAEDPRAKRVETRWRPSADGRWLWKGDTSSDEITGHFYGYLMYHELAANERDKREIAGHVARVMDHIIEGGYTLRDLDGEPTRWGVWSPARLNHDPLWAPERGINSVEILSYLKTTAHITGDERYRREYLRLAREEGLAENTRGAKTINPSVRTHIDDELLALAWPGLFLPMEDAELVEIYREGYAVWREETAREGSPFFNFTHAMITGGGDPGLADSVFFLRDAPMDLVRWTLDNSRREDMHLSRLPEFEHIQTNRLPPPSERGVIRWDENPWVAVQGDGGRTESDGVFWLLPYWMGRHLSLIEGPAPASQARVQ